MAISFEKERKIFHLSTKTYSYYIHVNALNYVVHLYDGEYLDDISKERVSERFMERYGFVENGKEVCDENYYYSSIASLMECASYGKGDVRGAFAIIDDDSGIDITNFKYESHRINKKCEDYTLPHPRFEKFNGEELVLVLKDEVKNVYLEMHYIISEKYNCLLRYSKLINKENKEIIIKKLSSMELDLNSNDFDIVTLKGTWNVDVEEETLPLSRATTIVGDNHGARGFYYNPSLYLKEKDATLNTGHVYGFSYIYSGDFAYEFKVDEIGNSRILVGFSRDFFEKRLNSNEEFVTPMTMLTYSSEGVNKMSQNFHDVIRDCIIPSTFALKERPILMNSWEAFFTNIDTEKIINFIKKAKELGIELVVIDDGWFGKRNDDRTSLGDWYVNEEKIDLKKVVNYAHSIDMKIGLWIEPEMISPDSDLYREHPEYALYAKAYKPTLFRHQLVLDLLNKDAKNRVRDDIFKIFDNLKFDYIKWDFNRFLSEAYSETLDSKHKLETHHNFILELYELLDSFTKRYPNILFETCASGGGRFDLGMLYYTPQIWGSDETDIVSRANIQHCRNIFYPLSTIGAHVSERKIGTIQDKACLAFFGTYGYELNINNLGEEDCKKIMEFNNLYKEWHHVVTQGDYYSLYNPYKSNYVSFYCITKDKKECLIYFMNLRKEATKSRFLKITGLDDNKYYYNSITNDIYKGSFYHHVGVNVSMPLEVFTSIIVILKEVDPIRANIYRKTKQQDGGKREKII